MRQLSFFALRDDLASIIRNVEETVALRYVQAGSFDDPSVPSFASGLELPQLGEADADSAAACRSFLVVEAELDVQRRQIVTNDGRRRTLIDQLENPGAIKLTPGGHRGDAIISGTIGTASDAATSLALLKRFTTEIRRQFAKIKAFYVGPRAEERLDAGARLTQALQSPTQYDLSKD